MFCSCSPFLFYFALFHFVLMKTKSTPYFTQLTELFLVIQKPTAPNIAITKRIQVANYFYFAWVYKLQNVSCFSSKRRVNAIILPCFPEPYIKYYLAFTVEKRKQKSEVKQYRAESRHLARMPTTSGMFSDSLDVYIFENGFADFYLKFEITAERQISEAQCCLGSLVF